MKKTKIFTKIGFRVRMRLTMILIIILVATAGTGISIYLQNAEQVKALNRFGHYVAINLAQNSSLGVLSEEPENVKQALDATLGDPQIVGSTVYLSNGDVLDSRTRSSEHSHSRLEEPENVKQAPDAAPGDPQIVGSVLHLSNDDVLGNRTHFSGHSHSQIDLDKYMATLIATDSRTPLAVQTQTHDGKDIMYFFAKIMIEKSQDDVFNLESKEETLGGFVCVDVSLEELEVKKLAILYRNTLLMPIYIIAGVLLSILAERRISKPLLKLKDAAGKLAKGDFSIRIKKGVDDEIGQLGESFNHMSGQLAATIEDLNIANVRLEKANKELQDFTYIVSHDLQEPLRKVHSFGQFLVEDYQQLLPAEGQDYVARMQNASIRMKELIQDLLKLSRIGTAEDSFSKIDTNEILRDAMDDLSVAIDESQVEIAFEKLPDITGNRVQLTQLFENLIGNAIKYQSDERKLRIEVGAKEDAREVTFHVKDNGIGIKETYCEKIFGIFQRLHSSNDKYKGTGIGLALCQKIVQCHGGCIRVESTHGSGSTFYFTISKFNAKKGATKDEGQKNERRHSNTVS